MEAFYLQWLHEEQCLLMDLVSVPKDRPDLHIPLISRALSHYAEYDNRKSDLAIRDIFQVLSAQWLTPLERSFLWLGGMKPTMIFRFVSSDLNDDHRREIRQLKQKTEERVLELEEGMRQVEETMTVLMALAVMHGHARNGEAGEWVAEMMRAMFDEADRLRKHVVTRIIDILTTAPTVQFLASVANTISGYTISVCTLVRTTRRKSDYSILDRFYLVVILCSILSSVHQNSYVCYFM